MRTGGWSVAIASVIALCTVVLVIGTGRAQTVNFSFVGEGFG